MKTERSTVQELVEMLEEALTLPELRVSIIDKFQRLVRNTPVPETDHDWSILKDLAHDLEYYEPDDDLRKEDTSYFGDQVAEYEIRSALKRIRTHGH